MGVARRARLERRESPEALYFETRIEQAIGAPLGLHPSQLSGEMRSSRCKICPFNSP
jgi:hypothetical protein